MQHAVLANHLGRHWDHRGADALWWILWLVVMAALVAAAVFFALRMSGRAAPSGGPGPPVPTPSGFARTESPPTDPALTELRLRYARGEISRDDYLTAAADLGASVAARDAPPPPSPPSSAAE